jgi:biotin carboxylase
MPGQHLLLVATTTGYQTRMFAEAAKRVGVRVTLATDRCRHLDDPWGDDAVAIRFDDPLAAVELLVEAAEPRGAYAAIVAVGDRTTFVAALAGERLGIPFHPPHAVEAANNKYLSKERFRAAGLLQPAYRRMNLTENETSAAKAVKYPCVLKPLGLSGSRGVVRVNDAGEFAGAFQMIRSLLAEPDLVRRHDVRNSYVQVESFIPGEEFAIEGIVTDGRLQVLALFDKPDPLDGPYFEETIYVTPSRQTAEVQADIIATVERGVAALGLCRGPVHAEVRHNEEGTWILEIAARPIGGYCARALQFDNGWNLEDLVLRHALGENVSGVRLASAAAGVMMIPIPKAGIYRGVGGVEQARGVPRITDVLISAVDGQRLKTYPEASSYLGFIFAAAGCPADVEESLRRAHASLQFDIATMLV